MLFNCKCILIFFINLRTVVEPASNVVKYNIPEPVFQRFDKEFERFKGHSDPAKEFERNHYNAIKNHILTDSDNVTEFVDLLKSGQEFLDRHKELKILEEKCNGHYCKAESVELLNSSREKYIKDSSIGFVGDNGVTYTEVNLVEVVKGSAFTTIGSGVTVGLITTGALAAGPIGLAVVGYMTAWTSTAAYITKKNAETKLDKCEFQYLHKHDCLDKCSDIKKEYPLFSTGVLLNVINEMISGVERYINNEIIFKNFENRIHEIEDKLDRSNNRLVNLKSLVDEILNAKKMINDIDDEQLDEENRIKFISLKSLLNVLSNTIKNLAAEDETSSDESAWDV